VLSLGSEASSMGRPFSVSQAIQRQIRASEATAADR
jgi:hypothetical protein